MHCSRKHNGWCRADKHRLLSFNVSQSMLGGFCTAATAAMFPVQNMLCAALQDPNPDDPLNKEAAEMQTNSPRQFEAQVQASILRGCSINGHYFPPCRA